DREDDEHAERAGRGQGDRRRRDGVVAGDEPPPPAGREGGGAHHDGEHDEGQGPVALEHVVEDVADGEQLGERAEGGDQQVALQADLAHAGNDDRHRDEAQGQADIGEGDAPAEAERRGRCCRDHEVEVTSITASASSAACRGSWVTSTTVKPPSVRERTSCSTPPLEAVSRADVGSSRSRASGSHARARARLRRWASPTDRASARRCTSAAARPTRSSRASASAEGSAMARFSATVPGNVTGTCPTYCTRRR